MNAFARERRRADAPEPRRPSARSAAPLPAAPALTRAVGNQAMLRMGGALARSGSTPCDTRAGAAAADGPVLQREKKKAAGPCAGGKKTVAVDLVKLDGSTRTPASDLAEVNRIFAPCCVEFTVGADKTATAAETTGWIGDQDLAVSATCGTVTGEQKALYDGATAKWALGSRMKAFFVSSMSGVSAYGLSNPPYCATGTAAAYVNHLVIENDALSDSMAHEFGHTLLNSGTHAGVDNPADKSNLMFAPGRTGSNLDASQCATIFGNA
ncbi:MAG TPA: hypothetical protein VFJ82_09840 [Longimicrobium sp.]|nr:hypothetical protein [Longimicrobium sp.]